MNIYTVGGWPLQSTGIDIEVEQSLVDAGEGEANALVQAIVKHGDQVLGAGEYVNVSGLDGTIVEFKLWVWRRTVEEA